ncbi:MAG TPA: hypothetical protein VKV57_12810 [bacterium]|nr:hypothetical protein [bacterium]
MKTVTIAVYLDDGRVFQYGVSDAAKAREHAYAIATQGYGHAGKTEFEHYPVHRILKVRVIGAVPTLYHDTVRGT